MVFIVIFLSKKNRPCCLPVIITFYTSQQKSNPKTFRIAFSNIFHIYLSANRTVPIASPLLLIEKFDYITKEIKEKLNTINDEEILDSLFRKAVRIDSIKSFETLLEKVQKGY